MVYTTELGFYDYCNSVNLEMGANFHRAMATFSGQQLDLLTSMYPFHILNEQNGIMVDVAGGMGHVSMFLAREFERMVFIVQDRKAAIDLGQELLAQESQAVQKRFRFWELDIFAARPKQLPERQSIEQPVAYFLKHVVHDWNDQYSKELLASIACVMQPADRLLIYDVILPSSLDGHRIDNEGARSAAIINLSLFGGRQRSESQYRALADSVVPSLVVIKIWGEDSDNVESMRVIELALR
jgi:ubiquinone/menaquinone biosynthesis C-methylase UbiE